MRILGLLALGVQLLLCSCGSESGVLVEETETSVTVVEEEVYEESPQKQATLAKLTEYPALKSTELERLFQVDFSQASSDHSGKMLVLKGRIKQLHLAKAKGQVSTIDLEVIGTNPITCYFDPSETPLLKPLKTGAKVRLVGKCQADGALQTVTLSKCFLLQ